MLVSVSIIVAGCSNDTSIPPPAAPSQTTATRVADALETLTGLDAALRAGDASEASGFGLGAAGDVLRAAAANVTRLDLGRVSLRYVQELASTTVAGTAEFGPDSWQATVAVEYQLRGWDQKPTEVETTFTFSPGADGQLVAAIGSAEGRTPLWLAGPVKGVAAGRTLVLVREGTGTRESRLARRALVDVGQVIGSWKGRLVIESPATDDEFYRVLGTTRDQYANIAAVTASVGGASTPGSPLHVFLNPALFDKLGPRAAQIVVSHETTHVATSAPYTEGMPTWLVEGFADYVALAHTGIGVQTAAAQILKKLKAEGLPRDLPSEEDLAPTAPGLGAAYEEAWLVNRFLAGRYGEAKLIAFYDAVDAGATLAEAFGRVLGTTQPLFVAGWRRNLRALVDGMAG